MYDPYLSIFRMPFVNKRIIKPILFIIRMSVLNEGMRKPYSAGFEKIRKDDNHRTRIESLVAFETI